LKEASPAKVITCALIALAYLQKDIDAAKELTGGASVPLPKMASQPWFVANRSPVMRADHHQCAKVPPIPKVVEHA
jgi:hypothetical protein